VTVDGGYVDEAARIGALLDEMLAVFLRDEVDLILTRVSERSLCGRLAIIATQLLPGHGFPGYFADTEYNRMQEGRVKTVLDEQMEVVTIVCDLIVHTRGVWVQGDNLLAIEMKKAYRTAGEKDADRRRLRALTKSSFDGVWSADGRSHPEHVCGYALGAFLDLDADKRTCRVETFRRRRRVARATRSF
jgi:hypothetical protein